MFVAASTACFPHLALDAAIDRLNSLEFSRVEIALWEHGHQLKPSEVAADLDHAIYLCRDTHRLTPVAYFVDIAPGEHYFQHFYACCRLAKATKVVAMVVRASEVGTPFNEEVERLTEMVRLAALEGVRVCVKTESGRMTQAPDVALVLCKHIRGLGVTLDPSHFICGPHQGASYNQLLPYVSHVQLRDTTPEKLQVRVGQGQVEYGRLIAQLEQHRYTRALCVDIVDEPDSGIDHHAELRKMRLLLESML